MTDKELEEGLAEVIADKAKVLLTEVRVYGGTTVYEPMLANDDDIAKAALAYLREQGVLTTNDKE